MSYKQLSSVVQPILQVGLPRSGIVCRNIARNLVFVYIVQGISKIQLLFDFRQQLSQSLVETSWSRTMVESGLGMHFLEHDYSWFQDVITSGWITSLWEFLLTYKIIFV
jgi:hypothetical protein